MPLPASTQWQLVEEVGGAALLVFPTLERIAANGDVVHNDDSHVKIIDIIHHNRLHPSKERTALLLRDLFHARRNEILHYFITARNTQVKIWRNYCKNAIAIRVQ